MKFIQLTRFDNKPVWLNAGFVVTVEPRRDGVGSVVVPIGDGLDYDVREAPEDVLKMLADEPAPTVVPVPVSDGLAPTPADVSPEPELNREEPPAAKDVEPKRRRRTVRIKADVDATKLVTKKPSERKAAKKADAPLEMSDEQIERLVKLSPKTADKLKNTLLTQFHIADVVATVQGLEAKGVFTRDGKRVIWS